MVSGDQGLEPSSAVPPGLSQGADWEAELPGHKSMPVWDAGATHRGFRA